jgi:hypothetical protein
MTQVLVEGCGWGAIGIVRDWYTKVIVGHNAGLPCQAQPWLVALDRAVHRSHGTRFTAA